VAGSSFQVCGQIYEGSLTQAASVRLDNFARFRTLTNAREVINCQ